MDLTGLTRRYRSLFGSSFALKPWTRALALSVMLALQWIGAADLAGQTGPAYRVVHLPVFHAVAGPGQPR